MTVDRSEESETDYGVIQTHAYNEGKRKRRANKKEKERYARVCVLCLQAEQKSASICLSSSSAAHYRAQKERKRIVLARWSLLIFP